jgi:hypothetical protein
LALRPVWLLLAPRLHDCPFRTLTGIPCPTCGGTRASLALLDGRLIDALRLNPLVTAGWLVFVGGGLVAFGWAISGAPTPRFSSPSARTLGTLRTGAIVTLAASWLWVIINL